MATHKVRVTQRPDQEIEVPTAEYEYLKVMGLLVQDDKVEAEVAKVTEEIAAKKAETPQAVEARPESGPSEIQAARSTRKDAN